MISWALGAHGRVAPWIRQWKGGASSTNVSRAVLAKCLGGAHWPSDHGRLHRGLEGWMGIAFPPVVGLEGLSPPFPERSSSPNVLIFF